MCCVHQYAGRHALAEIPRYLLLTIGLYWMPHHPTFIFFFDRELSFFLCDSVDAGLRKLSVKLVTLFTPYCDPIITLLWPHLMPHFFQLSAVGCQFSVWTTDSASSLNLFTCRLGNPDFCLPYGTWPARVISFAHLSPATIISRKVRKVLHDILYAKTAKKRIVFAFCHKGLLCF